MRYKLLVAVGLLVASLSSAKISALAAGSGGPISNAEKKTQIHKTLLAIYKYQQKSTETAAEYTALMALTPSDGPLRSEYAEYLQSHGQTDLAFEQFKKASMMDPGNCRVWCQLGAVYMAKRNYNAARDAYTKGIQTGGGAAAQAGYQAAATYLQNAQQQAQYKKQQAEQLKRQKQIMEKNSKDDDDD